MGQQTSFNDMFNLYYSHRNIIKDWTFIVATNEPFNMDLYSGLEGVTGVKERLFTPFVNGRVSIINDRILKRCIENNDSMARFYKCVSFDTQTVSYIERYYKNGTVPYDGFDVVVRLLQGGDFGVDHIPYIIENLLFNSDKKESVEQTLFAYEMMCSENAGNEMLCRKKAKKTVSMYNEKELSFPSEVKTQYKMIYLSLLKMSLIQLQYNKLTTEEKMKMFVEYIATKLCRIMQAEINLAKLYFDEGSQCGFFGKIHVGNLKIIDQLKNMTWDLMHLRFMDYSSMFFDDKKGDALIPYFFTYDKRLQHVRECYSLQALAINKLSYSVVPIYTMSDGILEIVREYCTLEKHIERSSIIPNIDVLISQCEQELLSLV